MPKKTEQYVKQVYSASRSQHSLRKIVSSLSLLVIMGVFWSLRLTGIGIAGEAFCGKQEHVHSNQCQSRNLICPQEELPSHMHTESCLYKEFVCGQEEQQEHIHEDACRITETSYTCGLAEDTEHAHTGECLTEVQHLICGQEERLGHSHDDSCWIIKSGFICGQREADGHTHTDSCICADTQLGCGMQVTQGHTHTDACYEITTPCELEAHIHTESCYSDITADLETSDDWEQTLADMVRGPTVKENVVLVAKSQLSYTESTLNFQVDANGIRRGITRYGQWYGNPYGDWSAMFASFCLDYAGAAELPMNAGPEAMRLEWEEAELYADVSEGIPEIGNLVFLYKGEAEENRSANAVAIITGFEETTLTVIEGDLENAVAETQYDVSDPAIMGYGLVPEASLFALLDEPALIAEDCTVWLDGTDGGLKHLTGSPNTAYPTQTGTIMQLPAEWTSPTKYSYKLRGWYDVTNSRYYPAGAEMEVTGNAVLYADWVAATYDLGIFNAQLADTVSTNSFITTHMFDYNYLFNVQSANAQVTVNNRNHSESWSMVTSGTVQYGDAQTVDFIFGESDNGGQISNPNNRDNRNRYQSADTISAGICTPAMRDLLYSTNNCYNPATGTGVIGKTYLGTGDHLFQIMDDPTNEHYGYYYYDSLRNAISYNQSNRRFYVYEYLSATSDAIGGSNADFLPLNSPYANTNGRTMRTYTFNGNHNEYQGVTHYRFDTSPNDSGVYAEFAYGMRSDIRFYLPSDPGSGKNKDLYGNDIEFEFSGDDDLWVLIDGILVLDIGGIHQRIAGQINFSTGEVTVKGSAATSLMDLGITAGDHTLTVLYLERGASMSNCSIYFNLVPRFGLELQKEDVLTQKLLDGTQFTVYEDFECTKPAELWAGEIAYNQDLLDGVLDQSQSTFTVTDGVAKMWGFGAGVTYYIKETAPPTASGYGIADGVIRLTIEKSGFATYEAEIIADSDGNTPSNGFTIHGVNIDEETKTVYIVVTNAPESVVETTTVQVIKHWEDNISHSGDYIQAYLTVTDPDGTVRRIREITLSDENKWTYTWTNLPKYNYDTLTEVKYGVEESYESGYYSTVRKVTQIQISRTEWAEAASFVNGESYILKNASGYLSTVSTSDAKLTWANESTAQSSPLATWTAVVSSGNVKFINGAGQILSFNNGSSNNSRYFFATTSTTSYQYFTPVDAGSGFRFYYTRNRTNYYMSNSGINSSNGRISSTTSAGSGLILTPMKKITQTDVQDVKDWAYQITNTPLEAHNETFLTVQKEWDIPEGFDETLYQEYAVTVRLLANGVNTGRSVTLTLKNGWKGSFLGLPYSDSNGNVIRYTVTEVWGQSNWETIYGGIETTNGSPPTYSVLITNAYHPGGPMLPSTGSAARLLYVLCGSGIILSTLIFGILSRRKRERRMK